VTSASAGDNAASPTPGGAGAASQQPSHSPPRGGLVLIALITGAVVANINLGIANVALPLIGRDLDASQDQLTAIANGFALGLAASVLYLGAIGDRYGRKLLFILGAALTIPFSFLAAYSPDPTLLAVSRFLGGFAAALIFPTTLSLITSLFSGPPQVRAVALWSGIGGGVAALGPLLGGVLLERFWWGSVFLITLPLVGVALVLGWFVLPWKTAEHSDRVDHRGGIISIILVGSLVVAIQISGRGLSPQLIVLLLVAIASAVAFILLERRAKTPLVDLRLVSQRIVWVAWLAGAITFGSLIAAMFIGQQFLQNVLGYSPVNAAAAAVPSAIGMMVCGQISGRIVRTHGSRPAFLIGLATVALAFAVMLATWRTGTNLAWVLLAYALVGCGVGFAVTPASRSLTASLPARRAGLGSALVDLTRDFGGAVMQAVMGTLLATVYAAYFARAFASLPPDQAQSLGTEAAQQIASSYAGAAEVAKGFSQANAERLIAAADQAFTDGKGAAFAVALALTVLAFVLVLWKYPRKQEEDAVYAKAAAE
jgi:DHA2 family multidrug resistance protein-like MFS transporter